MVNYYESNYDFEKRKSLRFRHSKSAWRKCASHNLLSFHLSGRSQKFQTNFKTYKNKLSPPQ